MRLITPFRKWALPVAQTFESAVAPGFINYVEPHGHILEEKTAWILAVRTDSTDSGRQVNQNVRRSLGVEPFCLRAIAEIVVATAWGENP